MSAWQQRQQLQQALARQPGDFVAWVMLADLELEAGDIAAGEQAAAQAESRRLQVGSGDRSQRIRTYSFPQGRITDHRVEGLTLYDLPNIMTGDLDALVNRLSHEHQADELARLSEG